MWQTAGLPMCGCGASSSSHSLLITSPPLPSKSLLAVLGNRMEDLGICRGSMSVPLDKGFFLSCVRHHCEYVLELWGEKGVPYFS